jgi:hypothetical protein
MPEVKTPEQKRAHSAAWHKQWRKDNPEKQQAIMDRFWAKKVAGMQEAHTADLGNIQAELKE